MTKLLKKSRKSFFGATLGAFSLNWGKNKDFVSFEIFQLSTINKKKSKKSNAKQLPKIPLHKRISESPG